MVDANSKLSYSGHFRLLFPQRGRGYYIKYSLIMQQTSLKNDIANLLKIVSGKIHNEYFRNSSHFWIWNIEMVPEKHLSKEEFIPRSNWS